MWIVLTAGFDWCRIGMLVLQTIERLKTGSIAAHLKQT